MSQIRANIERMEALADQLQRITYSLNSMEREISNAIYCLHWDVPQKHRIEQQVQVACKNAYKIVHNTQSLKDFVLKAAHDFEAVDHEKAKELKEIASGYERVVQGFKGFISKIFTGLSEGARYIVDGIKNLGSMIGSKQFWGDITRLPVLKLVIIRGFLIPPAIQIAPLIAHQIPKWFRGRVEQIPKASIPPVTPAPAPQGENLPPAPLPTEGTSENGTVLQEGSHAIAEPPADWGSGQKIQYYLDAMGFDTGGVDGAFGVKSSSSLILLQYYLDKENITGSLDGTTLEEVKKAANDGVTCSAVESHMHAEWSPGTPTIGKVPENNGYLPTTNMVRIPTGSYGNAFVEREAAVAWAMIVDKAKEDPTLNVNKFAAMGSASGYRSYHQQVEAYLNERHGGNNAADPTFANSQEAQKWIKENWSQYDGSKYWNNVPDWATESGGPLAGHGNSNHGWGLAVDMQLNDPGTHGNGKGAATTPEVRWLEQHGKEFGFAPLYERGETGNFHETWHWDYKP